ncbi:UPF0481 protein At3g47200-like [Corylus avellana]|uniref:UPF0481 protein At3g47200-like n=1 Tax=Corylus avellana TaxID=13451 RepID=UPI001E2314C9|nr:UPF0481 protein At3g47200-like [Corylus avellana]
MKLRTLTTPSAIELHEAGVLFKVREKSKNLFDIKFEKGKLEIPSFILSDEKEYSIRNSLAFEQCHCSDENYINDYVILIGRLVETRRDIDLLVKQGIIENRISNSRDGSLLLNKLADGAILDQEKFYFAALFEELNKYYNTSWHRWKAHLKQRYFRTPWAGVSLLAAVFLLILTIVQTVCSLAAFFPTLNPSSN